ncbi:adenosylcobinamide amidohydrolase [Streptomyces leeuwenhoekii]|uniref:Adenosylcobinamide amidohydrolase n=1 Tax=Streptomyces leeuwenhoekii TaxID=1437453 RepID=A0A0F7VZT6_STRLW|nr:Adenosylcobinamide amidohydrolase [Streptomyces leeuwenhoekii]
MPAVAPVTPTGLPERPDLSRLAALDGLPLLSRAEDGATWPMLLWVPGESMRMISTAVLGGGLAEREWVLNAQVPPGYPRRDPAAHLAAMAASLGVRGDGVGLMTAARVADRGCAADGGVVALVTAGLGVRGWAATPAPGRPGPSPAGTVNIVVSVPVPLGDAALVNAVATVTEAKVQALRDAGIDASGTPTDAVCVAAARPVPGRAAEPFAGPRSVWGARIARAVHRAAYEACVRGEADGGRHGDGRLSTP